MLNKNIILLYNFGDKIPRPREYDNLVEISVKIESYMREELINRNINISQTVRDLLQRHVIEKSPEKTKEFVRKSKFDDIPEDIAEKYGKRLLLKPWFHQGIIKVLFKETGHRFYRRELWDFFKQKYPQIGENKPLWENPDLNPHPVIIDKTKYSKKT